MEINNILTIIFSFIFVLFIPGFIWTYVFFAKGKIDAIERFALSVALSLAIVPLFVFYTNLMGVPIDKTNVLVLIIIVCCLGGLIIIARNVFAILKNRKTK